MSSKPISHHLPCFVVEPARIVEGPQDTKAIHGENVVIFCRASGNPEPQVTFLWGGHEVGSSSLSSSNQADQTTASIVSSGIVVRNLPKGSGLTLRAKLQMSQNGDIITCRVHNQFGTDTMKATITVFDANERKCMVRLFDCLGKVSHRPETQNK